MPPTARSTGNTRVFMVLHMQVYKALTARGGRKISVRFRETVEELSKDEARRNKLRLFYRRHSAFFSKEIGSKGKQIDLYAPEGTYEFLQSLSFFVFGYGNVSQLSRVIMYHFAVGQKLIAAPPLGSIRKNATISACNDSDKAKKRVLALLASEKHCNRRHAPLSVDSLFAGNECTEKDLTAIARLMQLGKSAALRFLVEQAAKENTPQKIRKFFVKTWEEEDSLHLGFARIRYRFSVKLDKTLDKLTEEIIGENNRSLTLRTIIAYMASQYGVCKY